MTVFIEFDDRLTQIAGGATGLDVNATSVHRNGAPAGIGDALAEGDTLRHHPLVTRRQ